MYLIWSTRGNFGAFFHACNMVDMRFNHRRVSGGSRGCCEASSHDPIPDYWILCGLICWILFSNNNGLFLLPLFLISFCHGRRFSSLHSFLQHQGRRRPSRSISFSIFRHYSLIIDVPRVDTRAETFCTSSACSARYGR